MNLQIVSTVILPLMLICIMFGLGMALTPDDFRRVAKFPKPVIVGLICQTLILPFVAFGLCHFFGLSTAFAIGLMILAASPGGVTSSLFSHLCRGDVALNITLAAINSALTALTLPVIVGMAIQYFSAQDQSVSLHFSKMLEVFFIILVPVSIGMVVRAKKPAFAQKMDKPMRIFSLLAIAIIGTGTVIKEWNLLADNVEQVGMAVLSFNILSLALGYLIPKFLKISHAQSTAVSFEIGIHNSTLAFYVAISILQSMPMAVPAATYTVLMYFTAAIFAYALNRNKAA